MQVFASIKPFSAVHRLWVRHARTGGNILGVDFFWTSANKFQAKHVPDHVITALLTHPSVDVEVISQFAIPPKIIPEVRPATEEIAAAPADDDGFFDLPEEPEPSADDAEIARRKRLVEASLAAPSKRWKGKNR
jgi:hypothetical protein